ncbi:MAG: hypothetical protein FWE64_03820, partial [Alphaproteobacteria bacterium]|nr:hypothetical protein [Alphaproteobacteria bacterium]
KKASMLYALCSMLFVCGFAANDANAFGDFGDWGDDTFIDTHAAPDPWSPTVEPWDAGFADHDIFADETITVTDELDLTVAMPVALNPGSDFADVMRFDIAGAMLGMDFEAVHNLFFRMPSLYAPRKQNSIVYSIPRDWQINLDYECRMQGIFVPAQLTNCINTLAQRRGLMYASEVHLVRESTGETVTVHFTSNLTDNIVWRVMYDNDIDVVEGEADKFQDQRDRRRFAFWRSVLDKYGAPNSGEDRWISSDNTFDPMMVAYFGRLDLMNAGIRAMDAAENFRTAQENFKTRPYSF